jgi:hypothetical protein
MLRKDHPVGLIEEMKKNPCGLSTGIHETTSANLSFRGARTRAERIIEAARTPLKILIDKTLRFEFSETNRFKILYMPFG